MEDVWMKKKKNVIHHEVRLNGGECWRERAHAQRVQKQRVETQENGFAQTTYLWLLFWSLRSQNRWEHTQGHDTSLIGHEKKCGRKCAGCEMPLFEFVWTTRNGCPLEWRLFPQKWLKFVQRVNRGRWTMNSRRVFLKNFSKHHYHCNVNKNSRYSSGFFSFS